MMFWDDLMSKAQIKMVTDTANFNKNSFKVNSIPQAENLKMLNIGN